MRASSSLLSLLLLVTPACGGDDGPGDTPDGDGNPPDADTTDGGNGSMQLCSAFEDHLTDGLPDVAWVFFYENMRLIREDGDELSDGDIDQVWAYTRDADGNVLSLV